MNLLPAQEKKDLQREISMRLVISGCFLLAALLVVGIVMLVPSYALVRAQHDALTSSVAQLQQTVSGKGSVEDELQNHAQNIHNALADTGISRYEPSSLIAEILRVRPVGVSTVSIAFSRKSDSGGLQLTGVGATREALIEYRTNISSLPFVQEAHYAESFIIQKVNIAYNLTVTIK